MKTIEEHPEIILLDLILPGQINRYEVCRSLRENKETKDIFIVMLTVLDSEQDELKGFMEGVDIYLYKPYNPSGIITSIKNWLSEKGEDVRELRKNELLIKRRHLQEIYPGQI